MLAITGLEEEQIAAIVQEASSDGVICIANRNTATQLVLAGEQKPLEHAADLATSARARGVTRLQVSGAWHSPLMSESRAEFAEALHSTTFNNAAVDLYPNVSATPVRSGSTIRDMLLAQYDSSVRWYETMRNMIAGRPDARFVETGPGRVLSGLLLSIDRTRSVSAVNSVDSLESFHRRQPA
jgi:[acyl-carrier-protein] S-malonyltransferase